MVIVKIHYCVHLYDQTNVYCYIEEWFDDMSLLL